MSQVSDEAAHGYVTNVDGDLFWAVLFMAGDEWIVSFDAASVPADDMHLIAEGATFDIVGGCLRFSRDECSARDMDAARTAADELASMLGVTP